ncbi:hypothetical protein [Candidatus Chlorohelix sp.]|uniref:hypothetical protein n=1 Tax=Candidatus Chlorohelix sp. TaxID=3139201 RepID=UPI003030C6CB
MNLLNNFGYARFLEVLKKGLIPLFFLIVLALVYQLPFNYTVDVGRLSDAWAIGEGFSVRESNADFSFRWTNSNNATVELPDIGWPTKVTFVGLAPRPDGNAPTVSLTTDKTTPFIFNNAVSTKPPAKDGRLTIETEGFAPSFRLTPNKLVIGSDLFQPKGDSRKLGLVLNKVSIEKAGMLILPPLFEWLGWTVVFTAIYILLKHSLQFNSGKNRSSLFAFGIACIYLLIIVAIRILNNIWWCENGVSLAWGIALPLATYLLTIRWLKVGITVVFIVSSLILVLNNQAPLTFFLAVVSSSLALIIITNYRFGLQLKPEQSYRTQLQIVLLLWFRYTLVACVIVAALFIRSSAVVTLEGDFDEPVYLRAARLYAQHLSAGDFVGVINEQENYEHPILAKLIFGAIMLWNNDYNSVVTRLDTDPRWLNQRYVNATVASITVGAVAMENPLAGLLIALNGFNIKYTSEVYLEAVSGLFATLMLLLLRHSKRNGDWKWWLAAIMLGLTGASKYIYAVGGIAALIWMLWRDIKSWRLVPIWLGIALLVFYLTNPILWFNPIGQVLHSLTYSVNYTSSAPVARSEHIWYQPIIWLFSEPEMPSNNTYPFPFPVQGLVTIITILSMWRLWKKDRLLLVLIGVNLFFLLIWPTKWRQYVLILTAPMALASAGYLNYLCRLIWKKIAWRLSKKT